MVHPETIEGKWKKLIGREEEKGDRWKEMGEEGKKMGRG